MSGHSQRQHHMAGRADVLGYDARMDEVVRKLGEVEVRSPAGDTVRLGSFWDGRPVLLAMIRHFG